MEFSGHDQIATSDAMQPVILHNLVSFAATFRVQPGKRCMDQIT